MTLTKNKMIREIGQRTRLKNRDIQLMLETLIDVWTESLVAGERIELENFLALQVKEIDRGNNPGTLKKVTAPRVIRRLLLRPSKALRQKLRN